MSPRSASPQRIGRVLLESDTSQRVARWLNPLFGSPSSPLETRAFLDSFGPSLMPRTSTLQGVVAGMNVLAARAVTSVVEGRLNRVVPPSASLPVRLGARAVTAGVGIALGQTPESDDETLYRAGARSAGGILRVAATGGAIYDLGKYAQKRFPAQKATRPAAISALALAGVGYWAAQRIAQRKREIERWPVPQKEALPGAVGVAAVVTVAGTGAARGYIGTRNAMIRWMGPGVVKNVMGRVANAGLWSLGLSTLYNAGVGYIGRANEKVDPGYATPPPSPMMSGHAESLVEFEDLGQQGRRYVNDVATPELIEEVMGEPAAAQPIRVYIGYNTEPVYPTGRAELALAELDRTGAFYRKYLLLVAPTGTGWVDHTMIEAAELLSRGDIATCCIQYGRFPSFLSIQKVATGRSQFRLLLWGVKQRLQAMPPEQRPKVLIFGESLGAWASSDVVMYQGIGGFDHYGIDKALWFGLPGLAKWSRNGMARGSSDLVPAGTVGVFDRPEQLAALGEEVRSQLRAIILSHDNDPIAQLVPDIAVQRPSWLAKDGERGRGVAESMDWIPIVTFWQTAIDAANAMVTVPGEFLSFGHDYRADTAQFVHMAYEFPPVTDEQMERVEDLLRRLEVERTERRKATTADEAPPPPAQQAIPATMAGGVPLQQARTRGARWQTVLNRPKRGSEES
ncbi:MAG: alpha/beta-hydrolase family protein [Acidimicrobiia bacterium]|nr:alpha/beta-hydrolase family protein [Acidimicrobiia bacterium]